MNLQTERALLERKLNSFNYPVRKSALIELIKRADSQSIQLPPPEQKINMHCHTFFSYNAYGHSPSSLVWLAKTQGFRLVGMVDFDVLDGVDEFLEACELVGICGTTGIETRVFLPEFSNDEINSPGEPGVSYHMGVGFPSGHALKTTEPVLDDLRQRADHRNQTVIHRLNEYFSTPITIDYHKDVCPLTPANSPTERHIIQAYINKAENNIPNQEEFWAIKLNLSLADVHRLLQEPASFQNAIRSKLIKKGGPGYITPNPDSFPDIDTFHQLIVNSKALPCFAWLDGTSSGEQKIEQLLEFMVNKGVVAVNIIPDRNYNDKDQVIRDKKVRNLYAFVQLAKNLDLPINIGTEMNSFGQKLVDDLENEILSPLWEDFLGGAQFIYGHTIMERYWQMGFQSDWAQSNLQSRRDRNEFYKGIGKLLPMNKSIQAQYSWIDKDATPNDLLRKLSN